MQHVFPVSIHSLCWLWTLHVRLIIKTLALHLPCPKCILINVLFLSFFYCKIFSSAFWFECSHVTVIDKNLAVDSWHHHYLNRVTIRDGSRALAETYTNLLPCLLGINCQICLLLSNGTYLFKAYCVKYVFNKINDEINAMFFWSKK